MLKNNNDDIDKVELFYTQNFSKENLENLCIDVAEDVLEKYFLSNCIDNATYEKEIVKIIKKLIILQLLSSFNQEKEFTTLLSIYIFKKHFKYIFQLLSEFLMQEVAYSNNDVINFLKYYSLDTLVIDRKKYRVPEIREDDDSPRWNVISMLGILKVYVKTQDQLDREKNDLKDLEIRIAEYYIDELSPTGHNEMIEKKFQDLEVEIQENASKINMIHDSLSILTNETERERTKYELKNAQANRMRLREEKANLTKAKVKQHTLLEYQNLLKQAEVIQRNIKPKNKIIEQNSDSYISIKNALAKALISKKQAI